MADNRFYNADRVSFTSSPRPAQSATSPRPYDIGASPTSPSIPLEDYRIFQHYTNAQAQESSSSRPSPSLHVESPAEPHRSPNGPAQSSPIPHAIGSPSQLHTQSPNSSTTWNTPNAPTWVSPTPQSYTSPHAQPYSSPHPQAFTSPNPRTYAPPSATAYMSPQTASHYGDDPEPQSPQQSLHSPMQDSLPRHSLPHPPRRSSLGYHPAGYTPATTYSPVDDNEYVYPPPLPPGLSPATSYQGGTGTMPFLHEDDRHEDDRQDSYMSPNGMAATKTNATESMDALVQDRPPPNPNRGSLYPISLAPRKRGEPWVVSFRNRKLAVVTYFLTCVQIIVFIVEIARNGALTGTPIQTQPQFNPMIGPSPYVLINMGARYVPCMRNVKGIQDRTIQIDWPCANTTKSDVAECTLSDLCGFSGVPNPLYNGNINQSPEPDQWFRFIVPIFLHAGIIHIAFNMLLQLTLGKEMELLIGHARYFLVYFASGIFGFVLGGNYAAQGIASTGASGSLFGIVALTLLDLLYHWTERSNRWWDLFWIGVDIAVSFVLGLLPGLDNFSHIGGFLMGLVFGICILRSPAKLQERIGEMDFSSYAAMGGKAGDTGAARFAKNPVGFFKDRKGAWWAWWFARAMALALSLTVFILLINNFYVYRKTCGWCKYLSCLPVNNWCSIGNLDFTTKNITTNDTSSNPSRRDVFGLGGAWNDEGLPTIYGAGMW